jgi:hypothetical protein
MGFLIRKWFINEEVAYKTLLSCTNKEFLYIQINTYKSYADLN